jgi:hypothetical protein
MSAISSLPQGLLAAASRILNGETTPEMKGEILVEHVGLTLEAFDAAMVKCCEAIEMKSISPEEKAKRKKAAEEYRASWAAKNVKKEDTNEDVNLEEDFLDEDSGANVQVAHQAVMKSAEEIAAIRKNKGTKEEYGKALVAHSNATQHLSNMVKAHAADFMSKNSEKK